MCNTTTGRQATQVCFISELTPVDRIAETMRQLVRMHAALVAAAMSVEVSRPLHMRTNILAGKLEDSVENVHNLLTFVPWECHDLERFTPYVQLIEVTTDYTPNILTKR